MDIFFLEGGGNNETDLSDMEYISIVTLRRLGDYYTTFDKASAYYKTHTRSLLQSTAASFGCLSRCSFVRKFQSLCQFPYVLQNKNRD